MVSFVTAGSCVTALVLFSGLIKSLKFNTIWQNRGKKIFCFSKLDSYKSHFDVDSYLNTNLILHNTMTTMNPVKFLLYGGPSCNPAPQFVEASIVLLLF